MKFKFSSLALSGLATLLMLASCGEDRSDEYYSLIQEDKWIYDTMVDYYLWYEDIPTKSDKDFFTDAETFYKSLLSSKCRNGKGDTYSTFTAASSSSTDDEATSMLFMDKTTSYGFDYLVYTDPTEQTTHRMARVLYVIPDSPAEKAGLKRGDWILQVGGVNLTENNTSLLKNGGATTITTADIQVTGTSNGGTYYIFDWTNNTTHSIEAARTMEVSPFYIKKILRVINHHTVGYLLYDRFALGKDEDSDTEEYIEEMKEVFTWFKAEGVTDFILDLRYNPGGYLTAAKYLASCLAPADKLGSTFVELVYNDKHRSTNPLYTLDKEWANYNLNLSTLYVLTTGYTASASESIINGLRPYMNVRIIGDTTVGKNVASTTFTSPYGGFKISPIVATAYNSNGESDYENGFEADYSFKEIYNVTKLKELGTVNDPLIYYATYWIAYGSPITTTSDQASASSTRSGDLTDMGRQLRPLDSSFEHRNVRGILLKEVQ